MLWFLWSGKETAYKIVSKITPGVSSAPRLYGVRYEGEAEEAITGPGNYFPGTVSTPCGNVSIRSFVNHDYIHCIGVAGLPADIQGVICDVDRITKAGNPAVDDESRFVREAAGKRLSSCLHVAPAEIDIRRLRVASGLGPPLVYCRGSRAEIDISLSHDGRFTAYAFMHNRGRIPQAPPCGRGANLT